MTKFPCTFTGGKLHNEHTEGNLITDNVQSVHHFKNKSSATKAWKHC